MNPLIEKVASILPQLEEGGQVYLFALAERQDIDRWDVILSAEWSNKNWAGAVRLVVDLLGPRLEPTEKSMIARIAVIPSDDPTLQALPLSLNGISPSDNKVVTVEFLGSDVRAAYIFKASRPPLASSVISPRNLETAAI